MVIGYPVPQTINIGSDISFLNIANGCVIRYTNIMTTQTRRQKREEVHLFGAKQKTESSAKAVGTRKVEGRDKTIDGYPLPLTGVPITKTRVVRKKKGDLKKYPKKFIPGKEKLLKNEMRITCLGSGNPIVRKAQAAAGWLVELGNGDKFIFDIGGGTVQNLWSLEIPPAELDKLFLTHLHLDHVGDFHVLFDAMAWARHTPLHVWGPSGYTKAMGTKVYCENMEKAALWHIESKRGLAPSAGGKVVPHEFDASKKSVLVYNRKGVKVYSYPTVHCIYGTRGYRLEYNGLSMSFAGDSEPSTFVAEQSKGVDVFIHESFPTAEVVSIKTKVPLAIAQNILSAHTTPDRLGQVFSLAKPKLGVGYHYFVNDDTIDPLFKPLRENYDGPVVLAQDLMVINVTSSQVVTRMAETDPLHWPPQPKKGGKRPKLATRSNAKIPKWYLIQ